MDSIISQIRRVRVISRHIYSTHRMKISHVSINRWIKKYTEIIKDYVDSLNPKLSDVWSLNEMYLNVKNTKKTGNGLICDCPDHIKAKICFIK